MPFKRILFGIVIFSMTVASISFAQENAEKPQAAVAPVAALGDVTEVQKRIIFNSLLTKLSQNFDLISQNQFEQAQEEAYDALEDKECTEEQCIRKIQEILQVENLFVLQILREGIDTQLSLTLIDLDKKLVESDYCENCNTRELNRRIEDLVDKLVGKMGINSPPASVAGTPIKEPDPPKAEPKPELPSAPAAQSAKKSSSSNVVWHATAITLTLSTAMLSTTSATEYNDLAKENGDLKAQFSSSGSEEERNQLESDFQVNQTRMTALKGEVLMFDVLTLIFASWEAYLLFSSDGSAQTANHTQNQWIPHLALNIQLRTPKPQLSWQIKF